MKRIFLKCCNSFKIIFAIYVASILLAGELYSLFEHVPFHDGAWWALVTALTIGYGDISPASLGGRIVGVVFSHFWIFGVVPMVIANIITKLIADEHKFTELEQQQILGDLREILARVGKLEKDRDKA